MSRRRLLILLAICNCAIADEISWLHTDLPPANISSVDSQAGGYVDVVEALIRGDMPNLVHKTELVPPARMNMLMKAGGPYCALTVSDDGKGADYMRYTSPLGWIRNGGLIVHAGFLQQISKLINKLGYLDLLQFAKEYKLRIGVVRGRSYGTDIDRSLQMIASFNQPEMAGSFEVLMRMLNAGRVDVVLGYEEELTYFKTFDNHVFIPVTPASLLLPVVIACSKAASANEAFKAVSSAQRNAKLSTAFQQEYERWLNPAYLTEYRRSVLELAAHRQKAP
ncbi:hypothetical protein ACO0LD_08430 [Undibacterium sp. Ji83W]|uniref:hypothetical protein n=1 Tax=Undibacterium sp. Ji83W TaxID=3413043 RepID=UPI003BF2A91F